MDIRQNIEPFILAQDFFDLSNTSCVHASFACVGMEGFLVIDRRCVSLGPTSFLDALSWLDSLRSYTKRISGRFGAYQVSHRRGVLLHDTPFLFVATPNPSWLGSGRKSKFAEFRRFLGISLIWLPLFLLLRLYRSLASHTRALAGEVKVLHL